MSEALKAALLERARREKASRSQFQQGDAVAQDGTYGQPLEGYFLDPSTGQMTSRELMKNNIEPSQVRAATQGAGQGFSLGTMDELAGAVGYLRGGADQSNADREFARAQMEVDAEAFPKTNIAGEVVGAVASPINRVLPAVTTVKGAATTGATVAAADAFNRGEGGFKERAVNSGQGAATGLLFSGLTSSLFKGASGGVKAAFRRAEARPTINTLKAAKNAAYDMVRRSGVKFDENDMTALAQRVARKAKLADIDDAADPQTTAALKMFNARKGEKVSLGRLDRVRQTLWDRYNRSDEPFILEMIGEIDDTIAQKGSSSELMATARAANSKYAKAQLLENAFNKARLQTAASGSGGNILNKYRQAVTSILTKPHEAKWFSKEELALMEQFVMGDTAENTLRRAGKLAPGGNGLMLALNVYAASIDPSMLAITAAGQGAKSLADRSAMRGSEGVLDAVSTGVIRPPRAAQNLNPLPTASAVLGNRLVGN